MGASSSLEVLSYSAARQPKPDNIGLMLTRRLIQSGSNIGRPDLPYVNHPLYENWDQFG